jgi:hypothetical protein
LVIGIFSQDSAATLTGADDDSLDSPQLATTLIAAEFPAGNEGATAFI